MKRILSFFVVFALCLIGSAFATERTATFGDLNASGVYRLRADTDQSTGTNYGWVTFAQDTGIYYPYTSSTTNLTLVAAQTGTTLVFTGTSDNTRFTLPTAAVGMSFTIVAGVAKTIQITPQSTDTIKFATNTIGQGLVSSSAAVGDEIELFCYAANTWSVRNHSGTFSHTGANP